MKCGISGKTNFSQQLNLLFHVKINRTSRLVMAASHHHGSVTTSVDLCVPKNRLFKRAQSSGEPADHWRVYCSARNKASNAVKAAKKKHLSVQAKVLADPNCSSSKWWRVAKEMCGLKANPCQSIPPLVNSSADLVCDDRQKADLLNETFIIFFFFFFFFFFVGLEPSGT